MQREEKTDITYLKFLINESCKSFPGTDTTPTKRDCKAKVPSSSVQLNSRDRCSWTVGNRVNGCCSSASPSATSWQFHCVVCLVILSGWGISPHRNLLDGGCVVGCLLHFFRCSFLFLLFILIFLLIFLLPCFASCTAVRQAKKDTLLAFYYFTSTAQEQGQIS